jgi:hypothetical protein
MQFICVSNPLIFSILQILFYGRHVPYMAFLMTTKRITHYSHSFYVYLKHQMYKSV